MKKQISLLVFAVGIASNCVVAADDSAHDIDAAIQTALATRIRDGDNSSYWAELAGHIYAADLKADLRWNELSAAELPSFQAKVREATLQALGGFPDRTPLNAQVKEVIKRDGYTIEKVLFESRPNFHIPAIFFRPFGNGPFPCVIIPCGHSDNGKGSRTYQRGGVLHAKAGIAALVYDPLLQGERAQGPNVRMGTRGHNEIGERAMLVGQSFARYRIWDAMRALDYVTSRPDVDASRLGIAGNSGGGTLTSLTMAVDPRVRAAAPSCYLTNFRSLIAMTGPQDAEQNIFGQLTFSLNHLGLILLRAPSPVMMTSKENDFFPFCGASETAAIAAAVYARLDASRSFAFLHTPGPHSWTEAARLGTVDWMRVHLKGETDAFNFAAPRDCQLRELGFDVNAADRGLEDPNVTERCNVMSIPGERAVQDLLVDDLNEIVKRRAPLPTDTATRAKLVSKTAGIKVPPAGRCARLWSQTNTTFTASGLCLAPAEGPQLSAVEFVPRGGAQGAAVLILAPDPCGQRTAQSARVRQLLADGRKVVVADLRGFGETDLAKTGKFYNHPYNEEPMAVMHYLLGESIIGKRAEDVISWMKAIGDGAAVEVRTVGRTAIPAAHARAVAPQLFSDLKMETPPPSWDAIMRDVNLKTGFTDCIHAALQHYDWPNL